MNPRKTRRAAMGSAYTDSEADEALDEDEEDIQNGEHVHATAWDE